nr:spatzle processing enzyme [Tenebrio molitor]
MPRKRRGYVTVALNPNPAQGQDDLYVTSDLSVGNPRLGGDVDALIPTHAGEIFPQHRRDQYGSVVTARYTYRNCVVGAIFVDNARDVSDRALARPSSRPRRPLPKPERPERRLQADQPMPPPLLPVGAPPHHRQHRRVFAPIQLRLRRELPSRLLPPRLDRTPDHQTPNSGRAHRVQHRRQSRVLLRRSADQQEVRPDGGALRQREGSAQNVETVSGTTGLGTSTSTTRYYSSVSVRLGEYNTETDTDCINNGFGEDCAPPPVNVQVEARIAHESYEPNNINQYHDIALLRLHQTHLSADHHRRAEQVVPRPETLRGGLGQDREPVREQHQAQSASEYLCGAAASPKRHSFRFPSSKCQTAPPPTAAQIYSTRRQSKSAQVIEAAHINRVSTDILLFEIQHDRERCGSGASGDASCQRRTSEHHIFLLLQIPSCGSINDSTCVILSLSSFLLADNCRTPDGRSGDCKRIPDCPPLYALFERRPISSSTADFLRRSNCGFAGQVPKVCCPTGSALGVAPADMTPVRSDLLPDKDTCGIDTTKKIYGGQKTDLDEFPWMALIEYEKAKGVRGFECGGVLISKKASVRLGEYNTATDIDCINNGLDEDCAPPPVNIAVQETIVHESYNPDDINQYHDIALLRLRRNVPVNDLSDCNSTYKAVYISLADGQLCAGGELGQDSCRGDSGGPLMTVKVDKKKDTQWYAVGIVSFGPSPCGMRDWPGVYTKTANYVNWIVSKLKA